VVAVRFWLAPLVGICICVGVWLMVVNIDPIFWQLGPSGLVAAILAGTLGGFASALVAPNRKVLVASVVGLFLTIALSVLLFRHGHREPRNSWIWYWPAWLVPSFVLGGYLGRRYWKPV
jgi:hypothetical protein